MTKREFIGIANVVKNNPSHFSATAIYRLADWLQATYPRFDWQRWVDFVRSRNETPTLPRL